MLDEKKSVNVIYLDVQKAVDNVPHKRLPTKLRGYGLHGKPLDWIKDLFCQTGLSMSMSVVSARKR